MLPLTVNLRGHTVLSRLSSDSLIFDCGGNHGDFSQLISKEFKSRVIAIEPNPALFESFPTSSSIKAFPYALASQDGEMEFRIGKDDEASSLIGTPTECPTTVAVQTRTLASLMAETGTGRIDLLKMDIEGAEIQVLLQTSPDILRKVVQFSIEFHDFCNYVSQEDVKRVLRHMRRLDFWICRMTTHAHGDVLLVNRQLSGLSRLGYWWILLVEKNIRGGRRILARLFGRTA